MPVHIQCPHCQTEFTINCSLMVEIPHLPLQAISEEEDFDSEVTNENAEKFIIENAADGELLSSYRSAKCELIELFTKYCPKCGKEMVDDDFDPWLVDEYPPNIKLSPSQNKDVEFIINPDLMK